MSGFYPDDFIEKLRDSTDLVEVIGQYVQLRKRGANWVGLCPFHAERTGSFTVTPSKGFFKCFGCGKAGDVYTFLMEHQNLAFSQAVELLAERLGVPVPRLKEGHQQDGERQKLFYANQFACEFYRDLLKSGQSGGRTAQEYLEKRGLPVELVERFELGWAPAGWDSLKKAALAHGLDEELLLEVGLLARSENREHSYDRFRERVLIPIRDLQGRVIAFGGRVIGPGEPKYLNSPETPLFKKGEVLFGLDRSRGPISREGRALVVEGYLDFLSLWAHGVEQVVAPLGTALTEGQARLLSRYTREVVLLYDADTAGLKATFRGGDELLEAGLTVRVATLPPGLDPDDFVRREGREGMLKLLHAAPDLLDRKMEILAKRLDLSVVAEREKAADKLLESVARCRDQLVERLYLQKVAGFIGVPESVLESRLAGLRGRRQSQQAAGRRSEGGEQTRPSGGGRRSLDRFHRAEQFLLALCLRHPEFIDRLPGRLGDSPLEDREHAAVFEVLREARAHGVRHLAEALYQRLPEPLYPLVARLIGFEEQALEPAEAVFENCWRRLRIERLSRQIAELRSRFPSTVDPEYHRLQKPLQDELSRLRIDLQGADFSGRPDYR